MKVDGSCYAKQSVIKRLTNAFLLQKCIMYNTNVIIQDYNL